MQTASSMGPQLAGVESQPLEELLRVRSRVRLPDGRRLCYRFWGHPLNSPQRAKRTILYMHGWPSSRLEASLLHDDALKEGIRIIAIDRPGYGHSTYKHDLTFESLAEDVECLLDQLGLHSVTIMASSGGSPYASACAMALPDRIEALLLVCPLAPMLGREGELQNGLSPHAKRIFKTFNVAPWAARLQLAAMRQAMHLPHPTMLLQYGGFSHVDIRAMLTQRGKADLMRASMREGLRQSIRGAAHDMILYATRPWDVDIESICCPTIIWIGDEDITTPPAMAAHYHSRIPGSRLHSVRGEAHLSLPFNHGAAILASLSGPPSKL